MDAILAAISTKARAGIVGAGAEERAAPTRRTRARAESGPERASGPWREGRVLEDPAHDGSRSREGHRGGILNAKSQGPMAPHAVAEG